jgi:hypothetical protein
MGMHLSLPKPGTDVNKILVDFGDEREDTGTMDELHLREQGFTGIPYHAEPSGVYALLRGPEVLYVGHSKSVYQRISNHRNAQQRKRPYMNITGGDIRIRPIPFDRVLVKWCPVHEAKILESELIHRYRPRFNIVVVEPLRDHGVDLEDLARQAGLSWTAIIAETEEKERLKNSSRRLARRFG